MHEFRSRDDEMDALSVAGGAIQLSGGHEASKSRISKPRISSERAEKINEILTTYCGEEVKAKYYDDGFLHFLDGTISKIDATWRYILLQGKRIEFRNLIDLDRR